MGNNFIYCGPPGFSFSLFLGFPQNKCVESWFENGSTYYVHKARTGIRRALELIGLCKGDEVLVPSYNCGSEVDALIYSGANIVPYRVDRNCNIDIADLLSRITPNIKAIYVIHYFGFPQDIKTIKNICINHKLYLIEDCALSLFSSDKTGKLGTFGDISIFSFPKTLPVPDGGLLAINNRNLILWKWEPSSPGYRIYFNNIIRLMNSTLLRKCIPSNIVKKLYYLRCRTRNIEKWNEELREQFPGIPSDYYYIEYNNNKCISNLSKHILKRIDYVQIIQQRRDNYLLYQKQLAGVDAITPVFKDLPENVCPLFYPINIQNRDNICYELNKLSVPAISWWSGYHPSFYWEHFPDACFLKNNTIALPVHQDLKKDNISFIVNNLKNIISTHRGTLRM